MVDQGVIRRTEFDQVEAGHRVLDRSKKNTADIQYQLEETKVLWGSVHFAGSQSNIQAGPTSEGQVNASLR